MSSTSAARSAAAFAASIAQVLISGVTSWQAADDVQIYQIATELSGVPAIGEVARSGQDWTLHKWWRY